MATLTIARANVSVVKAIEEFTLPYSEAVIPGQYARFAPSTGNLELGNASTSDEIGIGFFVVSVGAGVATVLKRGLVEVGAALGTMNFGAAVYLSDTDGVFADAAGTVSKIVGRVYPVFGETGGAVKRLLWVEL